MSKSKTGVSSIIKLVHKICNLVAVYGASDLSTRTTPAYAAAVTALVAACHAFEALDDFPAQIDATAPFGSEDVVPS